MVGVTSPIIAFAVLPTLEVGQSNPVVLNSFTTDREYFGKAVLKSPPIKTYL
ncbi:hypothetical protein ACQ86N_26250 [Puia sp. P3]|uniref:hypothetical protein n=1 Tax=Puia sp. P3 TaxID=3423952 RepID=UPI003D66DFCA